MKKFLTVLLALSVVFTYSFSAVGTAFAVTADGKYTSDDYRTYFESQWGPDDKGYYQAMLKIAEDNYAKDVMKFSGATELYNSATLVHKTTVKASDIGAEAYDFNATGAPGGNTHWTKDAYTLLKAKIREDIRKALEKEYAVVIEREFGDNNIATAVAPKDAMDLGNVVVYTSNGTYNGAKLNDIVGTAYEAGAILEPTNYKTFAEYQADDIYGKVSNAIANTSETGYTDDNANKIVKLKADALNAIAAIERSNDTDHDKEVAYVAAYAKFKADVAKIPTKDKEDYDDTNTEASVAAATAKYVEYGVGALYDYVKLVAGTPVKSQLQKAANKNIYEKGFGNSATIFGVNVADVNKPTLAEATAVNKAMRAAFENAAPVVKAYGMATSAGKINDLYIDVTAPGPQVTPYLVSINKVIEAQNVYADVVATGNTMKDATLYGVKVYNSENVDAAVKEAETMVYADLGEEEFNTAKGYIVAAADKLGVDLYETNFEYKKFRNAIKDAQAKFYKADGTTPQVKVVYGENKTPEADYVYLKSTYAQDSAAAWELIATDAYDALEIAESYADIDKIMADAAAAMSKLMLAKDEKAVLAARAKYQDALADDRESFKDRMGKVDYVEDSYDDAYDAGILLIGAANSLDDVVSAYNEAVALIKGIPTKAELDAAKKTAIDKIAALPTTTSITSNDKDVVVDALNAYLAYAGMYGSGLYDADPTDAIGPTDPSSIYNSNILNADLDAVLRPIGKDLQKRVDDMVKTVQKNTPLWNNAITDNQATALVALVDEINALVEEANAFNDLVDDANSVVSIPKYTIAKIANLGDLKAIFNAENALWNAELHNLLAQANLAKTAKEKKAVLDAYDKLTDRQKYKMEQNLKVLIAEFQAEIKASIGNLKITASSTAKKGSITVKWKVKGDTTAVEGYEIYRSTKKDSGYKKFFTTTKKTYKNTKSVKKGTRYYYKVRAIAKVDGKKVTSDWSNKAHRIAK